MSTDAELIGKRFELGVSDPFELGEFIRWRTLHGFVQGVHEGSGGTALLDLETPFVYGDMSYRYLLASPRHVGVALADALESQILVNCTRISVEAAKSESPFDLSSWRGGGVIIGGLRLR